MLGPVLGPLKSWDWGTDQDSDGTLAAAIAVSKIPALVSDPGVPYLPKHLWNYNRVTCQFAKRANSQALSGSRQLTKNLIPSCFLTKNILRKHLFEGFGALRVKVFRSKI